METLEAPVEPEKTEITEEPARKAAIHSRLRPEFVLGIIAALAALILGVVLLSPCLCGK